MSDQPNPTAYSVSGQPRPVWMDQVAAMDASNHEWFQRFRPPPGTLRRSAVLMLFGPGPRGEEVVLTERAHSLRSHPGQVSFPGGKLDDADSGPVAAALREAQEEVGIDPAGVEVVATAPALYLTPSQSAVTPVLAWWPVPTPVYAVDPAEVALAAKVPVADLVDPANRFMVTHPLGYRGPGFEVGDLYVWGFTAMLLSVLFEVSGLARPWDEERTVPLTEQQIWPGLAQSARLPGEADPNH